MYFSDSQEPDLEQPEEEDDVDHHSYSVSNPNISRQLCSHGHQASLCLRTQEGGTICLLCFSNLISDPLSPTVHVSYALSQFSQALAQPTFLHTFLSSHSHFIVSPFVAALCSFDDEAIARHVTDLIRELCDASDGDGSLRDDFIVRVADRLSSGALVWSRRQVFMLHCYGILLNYRTNSIRSQIENNNGLISNLMEGLELPSEAIRGEIFFVLYKLCIIQYASNNSPETDVFSAFCPQLLHRSLEALMKTQNDDVRLNCVALLTILVQRGFLGNEHVNYTDKNETDESLSILFAEAIKGSLLSSDRQVQISTLDLIICYLSSGGISIRDIQLLVEENIVDYIFEIVRFSEGQDPLAKPCLQALDLLSRDEESFNQRLPVGFNTLLPVLRNVFEIPFHPVHTQTLSLIWKCISQFPGVVSVSHIEEIILILMNVLRKNVTGEMGILPDTFALTCLTLVTIIKSPSHNTPHLAKSVREVLEDVVVHGLSIFEIQPTQLLHSLYLLKELYAYGHGHNLIDNSITTNVQICVLDVCATHLLPWLLDSIDMVEEELVLGILETFHSILLQDPDIKAMEFSRTLVSVSWFSFSFRCLGLFPTEKMKGRVYLMLSSLVDVILDNNSGQCIREAASFMPSDPVDLMFLLGQKNTNNLELSSCQSAILVLLHACSLHDDRLADEKKVLASLEQYILVSNSRLLFGNPDQFIVTLLVNIYGLYRSITDTNGQIPYSLEAEKIMFQLVTEGQWDLSSSRIHRSSLNWLFKQEKIRIPLCHQILKICQIPCSNGTGASASGTVQNQFIGVREIAELVAAEENYAAMCVVRLLEQLVEEGAEYEIISVANFLSITINIFPCSVFQLRVHGIGNAIRLLYYDTNNSYSMQTFKTVLLLVFNILSSRHSEIHSDDEAWLAVSIKLLDYFSPIDFADGWTHDRLIVIAIISLILNHSTNGGLIEASKTILFNTSLASAIRSVLYEVCSKGPALIDEGDGTGCGKTIVLVLCLVYFSIRSLHVVLSEVDWQNYLCQSNETRPSFISTSCHDLCKLLYFGSPSVKLVASYCLLELFTRLSEQRIIKQEELRCSANYLMSVMATLEGLVVYGDHRVAMNCSLCLSMVFGWKEMDMHQARVVETNKWCRIIIEEWVASISMPCLASNSYICHQPAIYIAVALLQQQKGFGWMRSIFDETRIYGIIENVTTNNLSTQMVSFFRELLNSQFLQADQIDGLNSIFQACRKQMYTENDGGIQPEEQKGLVLVNGNDDLEEVCEYLIHLVQSYSYLETNANGLQKNPKMLNEMELFFRDLAAKDHD